MGSGAGAIELAGPRNTLALAPGRAEELKRRVRENPPSPPSAGRRARRSPRASAEASRGLRARGGSAGIDLQSASAAIC